MPTPIPTIRNAIPFIPFRLQWGETYDVYRWQKFASSIDLIGPEGSEILDDRGYDESIRLINPADVDPTGDVEDDEEINWKCPSVSCLNYCLIKKSNILRRCLNNALDIFKEQMKSIADSLSFRLQQCSFKRTRCKSDGRATSSLTSDVEFVSGAPRIRGTDIDNDEDTDVVTTRTTPQISDCNANWSVCIADAIKTAEKLKKDAIEEYKRKAGRNPPPPYGDGKYTNFCSCCNEANREYWLCMGSNPDNIDDLYQELSNPISSPKGIRPPYYPVRV